MKRLFFMIIAIVLIMILFSVKIESYWDKTSVNTTVDYAQITIGEWIFAEEWQEEIEYNEGDTVLFEGNYYVRNNRGSGNNTSPGSNSGKNFWEIK